MSRKASIAIVAVLVLISVGLVFLASALNSYVPLFFCWLPQLAIPWVASKSSAGHPAN
jgi:hypothetical protein